MNLYKIPLLFFLMLLFACSFRAEQDISSSPRSLMTASFYGLGDNLAGKKTASGEIFNPNSYTAAHKSFPFGTKLKIKNLANNKSVIVRVNDRGPFTPGRDLDLSLAAAKALDITGTGVQKVNVEIISK